MPHILIVDNQPDLSPRLINLLEQKGYTTLKASNSKEALALLRKTAIDLIISDYRLPRQTGIELLQKAKILKPGIPFIIIADYSDVRPAVEAVKKGAHNYLTKPIFPDEILHNIQEALSKKTEAPTLATTPTVPDQETSNKPDHIWGTSPKAQQLKKHIQLIAPTQMATIIMGETGTGKEYAARAIHHLSKRKSKPFIAIDCGALPKELAGSELFGHVKGAFTGALTDKPGCFEQANKGTLFLDEIGNLTYENQIKLLRVLQEKEVKRLGATRSTKVNIRIIVATNENLATAVHEGTFREDLYHRLNEFAIHLPPLRERKEDIPQFAQHFLQKASTQLSKEVNGFSTEANTWLQNHPWQGNLRELQNVIKRAALLTPNKAIHTDVLPTQQAAVQNGEQEAAVAVAINSAAPLSLKTVVNAAEKKAILHTLKLTGYNKTKTADWLQVDRKTLYNKLKAYNIITE